MMTQSLTSKQAHKAIKECELKLQETQKKLEEAKRMYDTSVRNVANDPYNPYKAIILANAKNSLKDADNAVSVAIANYELICITAKEFM